MLTKSDLNKRELLVANHLSDVLRFGAAIGWWHDSHNPLHRTMASDAMDAAVSIAARDLVYRINEFDNETKQIKVTEGMILERSSPSAKSWTNMSASQANKIAGANDYSCVANFCISQDGRELSLDKENKIIHE